ncbi:MAG TPA: VOC family protein [Caulobacteraceae bacterium]|jgi:catechol 2,3-dioxygenase-like lactoylglutathione lyase family enzyme|nr:VOC family protein [Caulobacteraceae bacterium]
MLAQETLEAFLGTTNSAAARAFYEGVLGLTFVDEHEHLVEFDAGGARVRLQKLDKVTPPFGTALGWRVRDLKGTIRALMAKGVAFEKVSMPQDDLLIWSPVPGQGVAWFHDPDRNLLSLNGEI